MSPNWTSKLVWDSKKVTNHFYDALKYLFHLFFPCRVKKFRTQIFKLMKDVSQQWYKSVDWNSARNTWSVTV